MQADTTREFGAGRDEENLQETGLQKTNLLLVVRNVLWFFRSKVQVHVSYLIMQSFLHWIILPVKMMRKKLLFLEQKNPRKLLCRCTLKANPKNRVNLFHLHPSIIVVPLTFRSFFFETSGNIFQRSSLNQMLAFQHGQVLDLLTWRNLVTWPIFYDSYLELTIGASVNKTRSVTLNHRPLR